MDSAVFRARSSNDDAHPTQYRYSGAGSPGSRILTPSSRGPVGALGLGLAPRVRRALDVAEHRLGLGGEARLDHHQVAAQVDDVVDVLDRDRAGLTQAPQVTQSQTDSSGTAPGTSGSSAASPRRASASTRSRRPMITSLGDSDLPVAKAGQASWQRPHSVHENVSSTCFQVRSFAVPAPKRRSSSGTSGRRTQRLEPAARAGAPEPDVDRGGGDVQVLGAGQVGEEREDRQHVDPHEHALEHLRGSVVGEQVRERVGDRRPRGRPLVEPERDPGGVPEQQRHARSSRSAPGSGRPRRGGCPRSARPLRPCGCTARRHADQHEHREDVDEQRVPALVAEPRKRGVLVDDRRSSRSRSSAGAPGSPRR